MSKQPARSTEFTAVKKDLAASVDRVNMLWLRAADSVHAEQLALAQMKLSQAIGILEAVELSEMKTV